MGLEADFLVAGDIQRFYDAAVIGAGPVGTVAALAHADRGQQVLLLEANPKASQRFAGEWLHPPSLDLLRRLKVPGVDEGNGFVFTRGFVVFPDDGGQPIPLPYEEGRFGLAVEHCELVDVLRRTAERRPGVHFVPYCRAKSIDGTTLRFTEASNDQAHEVELKRIVGADGRSSFTRKSLGLTNSGQHLSYMGGLVLRDVDLPFEGYGHVVVGPPGPVLMYRIGPSTVRVTIDLPSSVAELRKDLPALADQIAPWLPGGLEQPFRAALADGGLVWTGTRFRPRCDYGNESVALVGDAVGHFHPLTAAGITMGFLDVDCLTKSSSVRNYQRQRQSRSHIPELLSNALYELFTLNDAATVSMRRAVYRSWRESPQQRLRLMRMLTGVDTSRTNFTRALMQIGFHATMDLTGQSISSPALRTVVGNFRRLATWGRWPMAGIIPTGHRGTLRASDWPALSVSKEVRP